MNLLENNFKYILHNSPQIDFMELCQGLPITFFRKVYSCGQRGQLPYREGQATSRSKRSLVALLPGKGIWEAPSCLPTVSYQ